MTDTRPSPLDDIVHRMEAMMDEKIERDNSDWAAKFQQVHEHTQAALMGYTNDRWEVLDKKIDAQYEMVAERSERWPEMMEKLDRVLESCQQRPRPSEEASGTPGEKQKRMAASSVASPGDRVILE